MLTLGVAAQQAREPLPGTKPYIYRTVGDVKLDLQVISPDATFARPRPAIVFFFGGGWTSGTQKQFLPFAQELAKRGMVGILVDYRVASRHKTTPYDSVDDAHAAMRWVKDHAKELGIDTNRIVAAGGSAGGHLALSTTLVPPREKSATSPAANLLIGYNPVADTREPRWTQRFGEKAATIAPTAYVKAELPDTLIFHGEADTTVPIRQVREFCDAMTKAGNKCTVVAFDGAKHGFFNAGREENRWYPDVLKQTIAFLKDHGYVK